MDNTQLHIVDGLSLQLQDWGSRSLQVGWEHTGVEWSTVDVVRILMTTALLHSTPV